MRRLVSLMCSALIVSCVSCEGEFRDDFDGRTSEEGLTAGWLSTGFTWQVKESNMACEEPQKTFCIVEALSEGEEVTVEATVRVEDCTSSNWKIAGVAIHHDRENYWHLALVQSPDDAEPIKLFVELHECLNTRWLADITGETRLPAAESIGPGHWEKGKPYRLSLNLSCDGVTGSVHDQQGGLVFQREVRFPDGIPAVKSGRPALTNGGFRVTFDDVVAKVEKPIPFLEEEKVAAAPSYDLPPMTSVRRKAAGFFRVEEIDGVWWLIDPNGFAFYDIGTDHARYQGHWCQKLGYCPYGRVTEEKYESEEAWAQSTAGRLREWGFNVIAAGHSKGLRYHDLVHTEFISFGAKFAAYSNIAPKEHWTGFPNVFHPLWPRFCDKLAREYCEPQKDDPWLLGYFLDNELRWYGNPPFRSDYGLVDEIFGKESDHEAKQALTSFLKKRYAKIADLNAAWETRYGSFDDFAKSTDVPRVETKAAAADKNDFLRIIAEKYFGVATAAIRKYDKNHLIIGCRFAARAPDVVFEVAGKHLDIVSVNQYPRLDLERETADEARERLVKMHDLCRRPMMLTEWSFPALDSGLPCVHGAGMRVDTQAQRAKAYEIYQKMLVSLPFMVGSHFFMWVDEPALGISEHFPEDTNYGLVNEQDEPYLELTKTAARVNRMAAKLHGRELPEINVEISEDGRQARIKNSGRQPAAFDVELWRDGVRQMERIQVGGNSMHTIPLLKKTDIGAHFVVVRADPTKVLVEANRSDNIACKQAYLAREHRPKGACTVAVANPAGDGLKGVPVSIPLRQLGVSAAQSGVKITTVGGRARAVPHILDGEAVTILVEELEPFSQWVCHILPDEGAEPAKGQTISEPVEIDNGVLQLKRSAESPNIIDEVYLGDMLLGRVQALIHQDVGQNVWVKPNHLSSLRRVAAQSMNLLRYELEFKPDATEEVKTAVDETGTYEELKGRPGAYVARYELLITNGTPYFAVRCLSVKNTDVLPWRLVSYFHYLPSLIGGDVKGDTCGLPSVPNYYGIRTVWFDREACAAYGASFADPLSGAFWLDEAGGQHPDIYRKIDHVLKPGEVWSSDEPWVYVFGVKSTDGERGWNQVARSVEQFQDILLAVYR